MLNTLISDVLIHIYKCLTSPFDRYALLSSCTYAYEILYPRYMKSSIIPGIVTPPYIREFITTRKFKQITYVPVDNELYAICMAIKLGGAEIITTDKLALDKFIDQLHGVDFKYSGSIKLPKRILDIHNPDNSAIISDVYPQHKLYKSNLNHIYIGNYSHNITIYIEKHNCIMPKNINYMIKNTPIDERYIKHNITHRLYVRLEENLEPIVNTTKIISYDKNQINIAIHNFIKDVINTNIIFMNCKSLRYGSQFIRSNTLPKENQYTHVIYSGTSLILPRSSTRKTYNVLWIEDPVIKINIIAREICNASFDLNTTYLIFRLCSLANINFFELNKIEQKIIIQPKMSYFDEWKKSSNKTLNEEQILKILAV